MTAVALSILAFAAGVFLLLKVKRDFMGTIPELLAWLVITLSLASTGFSGYKAVTCNKNGCCKKQQCTYTEKQKCSKPCRASVVQQ